MVLVFDHKSNYECRSSYVPVLDEPYQIISQDRVRFVSLVEKIRPESQWWEVSLHYTLLSFILCTRTETDKSTKLVSWFPYPLFFVLRCLLKTSFVRTEQDASFFGSLIDFFPATIHMLVPRICLWPCQKTPHQNLGAFERNKEANPVYTCWKVSRHHQTWKVTHKYFFFDCYLYHD